MKKIGFKIDNYTSTEEYSFSPLALISLKKAVKSFYTTYKGMNRHAVIRDDDDIEETKYYPISYFECYLDSIVYFHHFFEITFKDILSEKSKLLTRNFNNIKMRKVIYALERNEKIDTSTIDTINTVEFSTVLETFKAMESELYPDKSFAFLVSSETVKVLERLNEYRNKILHGGRLVFRYTELDAFIGGCLFPIIKQVFKHNYYKGYKFKWYNKEIDCKTDIFEEIIKECKLEKPNHRKIAVLKEMGRASYEVPKFHERKTAIDMILGKNKCPQYCIDECPVCGQESLIVYEDWEECSKWTDSVECLNCGFDLWCGYIGDVSDFGINIKNYFK